MTRQHAAFAAGLAVLVLLPWVAPPYFMHLLIQILLWGFVYTAWSMMGRFGFVSLGHGAFMGVGAYVPALLWNYYAVTPWIGIPLGVVFQQVHGANQINSRIGILDDPHGWLGPGRSCGKKQSDG